MTNQRNEAEVLAIKLQAGLSTVADAIAWADLQIAAVDDPHPMLLEVSMASKRNNMDVVAMLRQFPGEVDIAVTLREVFECIKLKMQSGPQETAIGIEAITQLATRQILPEGRFAKAVYWFDGQMDLFAIGYSLHDTQEQVVAEGLRHVEESLEELENELK